VDHGGKGVAIVGPPKSGKTTLTYGLLLDMKYSFLTDDWFFVRLADGDTLVYASEKNSYIRSDLAENWPALAKKLKGLKLDKRQRAIVDVKRFFGENRIRKNSTLGLFVILTREKGKPALQKLDAKAATAFMLKHDFCNPHQLVRTKKKKAKRTAFFKGLFQKLPVYMLNTIETPKQSLDRLRILAESS
jgi:serine kinase of HPr protein (carbohydrate metabolism regulator)